MLPFLELLTSILKTAGVFGFKQGYVIPKNKVHLFAS